MSKHIAFICSRLDLPGGIERAIVNMANLFVKNDHKITLVILDKNRDSFYPIDPAVEIIQQALSFGISPDGNVISRKIKLLSDVLKLRKIMGGLRPDIVISTEYPFAVAAVLAGVKKYSRLYAWEHHHHAWIKKNRFWSFLSNQAYQRLNGIICLNEEEKKHYKKIAPALVIPNFVENNTGKRSSNDKKAILSVGWLIRRKGIDLMLATAKEVLHKHPGWVWKLIGDGEMKREVLEFIKAEKLEDQFILQLPVDSNINDEYLDASLFVLSSRFEAFPMVLLEAMSFGVPCISFDCPSGPSDIITHRENGLLVEKENTASLSASISLLITDNDQRRKMSENALKSVGRFSPAAVYQLWKDNILT